MVFFLYTVLFAAIDLALTTRPRALIVFCAVTMVLTGALMYRRRVVLAALGGLRFEEEDPDLMFQGFNLSEGMAARPRAAIVPELTLRPANGGLDAASGRPPGSDAGEPR
jgi:hypothetical protein